VGNLKKADVVHRRKRKGSQLDRAALLKHPQGEPGRRRRRKFKWRPVKER